MATAIIKKISERKRTDLRFERLQQRVAVLEQVVIHQAAILEQHVADRIATAEVLAEVLNQPSRLRRPIGARVQFTPELVQVRRDAVLAARAAERKAKAEEQVKGAETTPAVDGESENASGTVA